MYKVIEQIQVPETVSSCSEIACCLSAKQREDGAAELKAECERHCLKGAKH